MLRRLFQTENELTFPVSGTGSAGMETCLVNLIEEGDTVLVCVNGVFGTRMADIVERLGGNLVKVEAPWGEIIRPEQVEQALKEKHGRHRHDGARRDLHGRIAAGGRDLPAGP